MGCCCSVYRRTKSKSHSTVPVSDVLETATVCPLCGLGFSPGDTHRQLNSHIDHCIRLQPLISSVHSSPEHLPRKQKKDLIKLSYERKSQYFRKMCNKVRVPWSQDSQVLVISRDRLLEDSLNQLESLQARDYHKEFAVHFEGEEAQDAGGVFKEWLSVVSAELFRCEKGLFRRAEGEEVRYEVDPKGSDGRVYGFTGKLLAKALYENVPVNIPLCTPLYRQLAGSRVKLIDLRDMDKDLYESLLFIKSNPVADVILNAFTVTNCVGEVVELKPGGGLETVSEENKLEYVSLRKKWRVEGEAKAQIAAFLEGFHTVIPEDSLCFFEPGELELLMCGLPVIDVKEWEEYTDYRGEFTGEHQVIQWFWGVVGSMNQQELSQLLAFSMGTSRLPVEGFRTLKTLRGESARFTLQSVIYEESAPFPKAHTCFNRVDLPLYPTRALLQKHLSTALQYCLGFGIE